MVVSRARVLGACGVAVWSVVACASPPPQPRSADLIMPEWVSGNEPANTKSKTTKRLVQKPGVLYGDPVRPLEPTEDEKEAAKAAREERERKADRSTLLPSSANSRFFGGTGCIDTPTRKCH
jgi:hypothetical protein